MQSTSSGLFSREAATQTDAVADPVERIVEVEKVVYRDHPGTTTVKEVPKEVIKYVDREVIKEVPVEIIKEVPQVVTQVVEKEVVREVPRDCIQYVDRPVEVVKFVTVDGKHIDEGPDGQLTLKPGALQLLLGQQSPR